MNSKTDKGFIPVILILIVLIGIGGAYYFGKSKPQNIVESRTPTPISVADWKTYTNSKHNFEFKHPNNWNVWTDNNNFNMMIGPTEAVSTLPKSTDENKVIYLMMSGPGQTNLPTAEIEKGGRLKVSESKFKINGLDAITRLIIKVSDNSFSELETEIITPNSQYNAVFTIRNKQLENQFNQILSTFKFIE